MGVSKGKNSSNESSHKRAGAAQSPDNAAEAAIVEYILGEVVDHLTDRRGGRKPPPWEPKKQIRIGVLEPRWRDDHTPNRPEWTNTSSLGVDFLVAPEGDRTEIILEIDLNFALYLPYFPIREEVLWAQQKYGEDQPLEPKEVGTNTLGGSGPTGFPITEAWERSDVRVSQLRLSVPLDGSHMGAELGEVIDTAVREIVDDHFKTPNAARPFSSGTRTIPVSALGDDEAFLQALADRTDTKWQPNLPVARVQAFAERLPDGKVLVSVSLVNESDDSSEDHLLDANLYDAGIAARILHGGKHIRQRFSLAPSDYRYEHLAEMPGQGRACIAVERNSGIASETLPLYRQPVERHRTSHLPQLTWADLALDPVPILGAVEESMEGYISEWDKFLSTLGTDKVKIRQVSEADRENFRSEKERFALGRQLLAEDARLMRAFRLANEVFDRVGRTRGHSTWYPFQLAYIICNLGALAGREYLDRADLQRELEYADVLWFPTGGGKTEAYLGLIVVALYYDRLRGKSRGISALLRFPLRMLSAQQLDRILRVVVEADAVRVQEGIDGTPFALGYLVGGGNTPNNLRYRDKWWPGIAQAHTMTARDRRKRRLIGGCPFCGASNSVTLTPDQSAVRLLHTCRACQATLPVHVTDEEVYRYQPSVIVSTIDKITGYAFFGEFTAFTHGPRFECPEHGYFSFKGCLADGCTIRQRDASTITDWIDPVPSLIVQDELHLVAEELGTFASHFEVLIAHLQKESPSRRPSKILAASATIQGFEEQVRQVYGRVGRRFPSPGFEGERSFYIERTKNLRRLILGMLPRGGGTAKVEIAGRIQSVFVHTVQNLQDDPSPIRSLVEAASGTSPSDGDLQRYLFNYDVSLSYVNRLADAAIIADELRDLDQDFINQGLDSLMHEVLTGDVPLGDLAAAINQVETGTTSIPRADRLRALVGTSVISHGVDLERLNLMTMSGFPTTVADYIQASSRAGRIHVGLITTIFDHYSLRESSTFAHFLSTHRFLDRLVEVVPVNKYARRAVHRTLPAIVMALLWDMARDPTLAPPFEGIKETRYFQRWWNAQAANIRPLLLQRLHDSYSAPVSGASSQELEEKIVEWARAQWESQELPSLQSFLTRNTADLFAGKVMTSLRDVDENAVFTIAGGFAGVFDALR